MRKKLAAIAAAGLAVCLSAFVLAGCGNSTQSKTEESSSSTTAAEQTATTDEVSQRTVYVSADWAKQAIDGQVEGYEDVVVACVAYPMEAADAEPYAEHIPGAIYVSNQEVEDATGSEEGAYNLLSADEVADYLVKKGITKDTKVLLYGADISGTARNAYAYLWCGVEDVKIINGGLDAWKAAGYDTEKTENKAEAASEFGCSVPAHPEYWTSIDDAKSKLESDDNFKLVSIRSEEEWLGETSGYTYMDKAGEPEGAVWGKGPKTAADVADFTNEDGTVKTLAEIEEVWADCDFTLDNELAFYCGTGWRACVPFLVMYENGYDNISVYDGGWYEWLMHDDFPVQVGDPASDDCEHTTVGKLPGGKASKE